MQVFYVGRRTFFGRALGERDLRHKFRDTRLSKLALGGGRGEHCADGLQPERKKRVVKEDESIYHCLSELKLRSL